MVDLDTRVTVRVSEPLAAWAADLAARRLEPASTGLRLAAETLSSLLVSELTGMVWRLGEAQLMAEAVAGSMLSAGVGRGVLAGEVEDLTRGLEQMFADKHDLTDTDDVHGLVARLRELTPGQDLALRDALSRWWADDPVDGAQGFLDVGVRVV